MKKLFEIYELFILQVEIVIFIKFKRVPFAARRKRRLQKGTKN